MENEKNATALLFVLPEGKCMHISHIRPFIELIVSLHSGGTVPVANSSFSLSPASTVTSATMPSSSTTFSSLLSSSVSASSACSSLLPLCEQTSAVKIGFQTRSRISRTWYTSSSYSAALESCLAKYAGLPRRPTARFSDLVLDVAAVAQHPIHTVHVFLFDVTGIDWDDSQLVRIQKSSKNLVFNIVTSSASTSASASALALGSESMVEMETELMSVAARKTLPIGIRVLPITLYKASLPGLFYEFFSRTPSNGQSTPASKISTANARTSAKNVPKSHGNVNHVKEKKMMTPRVAYCVWDTFRVVTVFGSKSRIEMGNRDDAMRLEGRAYISMQNVLMWSSMVEIVDFVICTADDDRFPEDDDDSRDGARAVKTEHEHHEKGTEEILEGSDLALTMQNEVVEFNRLLMRKNAAHLCSVYQDPYVWVPMSETMAAVIRIGIDFDVLDAHAVGSLVEIEATGSGTISGNALVSVLYDDSPIAVAALRDAQRNQKQRYLLELLQNAAHEETSLGQRQTAAAAAASQKSATDTQELSEFVIGGAALGSEELFWAKYCTYCSGNLDAHRVLEVLPESPERFLLTSHELLIKYTDGVLDRVFASVVEQVKYRIPCFQSSQKNVVNETRVKESFLQAVLRFEVALRAGSLLKRSDEKHIFNVLRDVKYVVSDSDVDFRSLQDLFMHTVIPRYDGKYRESIRRIWSMMSITPSSRLLEALTSGVSASMAPILLPEVAAPPSATRTGSKSIDTPQSANLTVDLRASRQLQQTAITTNRFARTDMKRTITMGKPLKRPLDGKSSSKGRSSTKEPRIQNPKAIRIIRRAEDMEVSSSATLLRSQSSFRSVSHVTTEQRYPSHPDDAPTSDSEMSENNEPRSGSGGGAWDNMLDSYDDDNNDENDEVKEQKQEVEEEEEGDNEPCRDVR
eukprot:ANDGO_04030.mRNA.1 hypothetical protein